MDEHVVPASTLFVRNLPFFVTDDKLGEIFSETGPVKRAFVVKEKGNSNKSRGFGYVTYSFEEDAQKAKETINTINGRKVFVSFAEKKHKLAETKNTDVESSKEPAKDTYKQTAKYDKTRTLVVSGFIKGTPLDKVKENVEFLKNVASLTYPVEKNEKNFALVAFRSIRDARRAMNKLNGKEVAEGCTLKVIQQSYDPNFLPSKVLKMRRLIVRNLAFTVNEEDLKKSFEKFGEVHEVVIPKKNGKKCGFGFVQFTNIQHANKALLQMNKEEIQGRPVAVDWSVPKSVFLQTKESSEQTEMTKKKEPSDDGSSSDDDDDDDDDSVSTDKEDEEEKEDEDETKSLSDSDSDASETSSGTVSSVSGSDESDSDVQSQQSDDDDDDDDSEENDNDDDDSDESDGDDIIMEDDIKADKKVLDKKPVGPPRKSDVGEGRTLFVRNVPFNCDQDELGNLFTEYGPINYCVLPKDKSNIPRGTAFVQFVKKENAEKCLENTNSESENGGMMLDGRKLLISKALSREEAVNLKLSTKDVKKDSRNLYLAREGLIRAGMKAAEDLSKTDLNKRLKIEMTKRQKLKDPNIFISPTRICVHNIPTQVDDKELRKVYLNAVNDKSAIITECRIMRDLDRTNAKGLGKSRGYAFIAFSEHKHALAALRNTNNNPDIFGTDRRLIVEFSLENKRALEAKQNRLNKAKIRQESLQGMTKDRRKKKDIFATKDSSQAPGSSKNEVVNMGGGMAKKPGRVMPSHIGAKKRHRDRGKNFGNLGKKTVKEKKIRQYEDSRTQNKLHSKGAQKRQRQRFADDFDLLVSKYKKRILSAGAPS